MELSYLSIIYPHPADLKTYNDLWPARVIAENALTDVK
jgi:hypothetical protein